MAREPLSLNVLLIRDERIIHDEKFVHLFLLEIGAFLYGMNFFLKFKQVVHL